MASWVIANGVNPGLTQGKPNETASFPVAVPVASQPKGKHNTQQGRYIHSPLFHSKTPVQSVQHKRASTQCT